MSFISNHISSRGVASLHAQGMLATSHVTLENERSEMICRILVTIVRVKHGLHLHYSNDDTKSPLHTDSNVCNNENKSLYNPTPSQHLILIIHVCHLLKQARKVNRECKPLHWHTDNNARVRFNEYMEVIYMVFDDQRVI